MYNKEPWKEEILLNAFDIHSIDINPIQDISQYLNLYEGINIIDSMLIALNNAEVGGIINAKW